MARFFRPGKAAQKPIGSDDYLSGLSAEFKLPPETVLTTFRGLGYDPEHIPADQRDLLSEILACRVHDLSRYRNPDEAYGEALDAILRDYDEIYIDTAPLIQMDWFLHFVADAEPILKRRKKKLLILEKTMEELHGLKDNPEKDREVRVRATIRPDLIRNLARRGVVRIGDTGSTGIADDHLVNLFARIGKNENLLLITQDRGLSERIVRLAHSQGEETLEPLPRTFWQRLTGKEQRFPIRHTMVVCKLTEGGFLKRCYICPDCQESYYDEVSSCDGIVPCSKCIMMHKAKAESAARQSRRVEEQRKREEKQAAVEKKSTLEDRINERRHRLTAVAAASAAIVLAVFLIIAL